MRVGILFLASLLCVGALSAQSQADDLKAQIEQLRQQLQAMEAQLRKIQERATPSPPVAHLSGFAQFRYVHDTTRPNDANERGAARDDFRLQSVRVDVIAQPTERTVYRVNLNANNMQVRAVDAFILWRLRRGQVQVGLFRLPLLYETLESNADRLLPDTSRLTETLFPTERDVGIAYTYPLNAQATATLGIFTGDRNSNTQQSLTARKSGLVRFTYRVNPELQLWVGGMFGEGRRDFNGTLANYTRNRWGAGVLWQTASWSLRTEYVGGKHAGNLLANRTVNVQGGYVLLHYAISNTPWLLYGRYDTFDSNTATAGNTFSRYALGAQYLLNPATRFNLTWERPTQPTCSEQLTLQVQVRY
ncbi:MAG: hypothetical protein C4336_02985 [Armatimonadota bacterium]